MSIRSSQPRRFPATGGVFARFVSALASIFLLLTFGSQALANVTLSMTPSTYSGAGDTITYNVTLFSNSFQLTSINTPIVSAIKGVAITCPPLPGGVLEPGNSHTCTGTYTTDTDDASSGFFADFVTISGTRLGGGGSYSYQSPTFTAQQAGGGPVTVSVTSSPAPSLPGQAVTVTAVVTPQGCNAGSAPPGTATITIGPQTQTVTLAASFPGSATSEASFTTTTLPLGIHDLSASYTPATGGFNNCSAGTGTGADHYVDTRPTVTINTASGQPDPTDTSPVLFDVVFDKPVTGFTGSDVQVGGGTTATVSGSGQFYTVAVSGMTQSGIVTAYIPAGGAAAASGLTNLASTFTNNTVNFVLIELSPASLPNGTFGQAYSQTITASGGGGGYAFAVTGGALPSGLTLSPSGTLAGTPAAHGTFNFTVTATDSDSFSNSRSYTLNIAAPTLSLSPASLPPATVGMAYSQSFSASGGTPSYSYAVTGALPAGLTLSSGGVLSGTPTAGGSFSFSVTATDSSGGTGPFTVSQPYTLTVNAPTITLSPATLPSAQQDEPYNQTVTATGGTPPHSFAVIAGALPAGLSVSAAGVISGTPTAQGGFTFTVAATDSSTGTGAPYTGSQTYSGTILPPNPPVANPVSATVAAYSTNNPITLNITGGTPTSVAVGTAPANGTATASGTSITYTPTPGHAGPDSFTYTATNSGGTSAPATVTITVTPPTVVVAPASLANATAGVSYAENITASGGTGPYTYDVTTGVLPAGLNLDPGGSLAGTPTEAGTFQITVTATDNYGFIGSQAYSLIVNLPTISVSPATLPGGQHGAAYSQVVTASGGIASYTYAVTAGTLPTGLALSSAGVLSGTPSAVGTFNFTVTASDSTGGSGPGSGSQAYTVSIAPPNVPSAGDVAVTIPANSTDNPIALSIVGVADSIAVPTGPGNGTVSVSGLNITYTPTAGYSGTDSFTYTATNVGGTSAPATVTVTVSPATLSMSSLPASGQVTVPYNGTITASLGTAPYSFTVTTGTLPTGLTLTPAGVLSGTPTADGTFLFTVTATDAYGATGAQAYSIVVSAPTVTIDSPAAGVLPQAVAYVAYTQTFAASGGLSPHTFSVTAGALPPGLTLAGNGTLSGTPTTVGAYSFSVQAADSSASPGPYSSPPVAYTFDVVAPTITITPASLPIGSTDSAYSVSMGAAGGTSPYTFAVTAGALPAGLTLAANGLLSGTPQATGDFTFTATATDANGFAGSLAYSLTVSAPVPVAVSKSVDVLPGTTTHVDLTAEATGGPFTAAAVLANSDPSAGTASIEAAAGAYSLVFAAADNAQGAVEISYTLSNQWGTSEPAVITFNVLPLPDPSKDSEVIGLLNAQVESARRLASAQIDNINRRLEQLHEESGRQNTFNLQIGSNGGPEPLGYAEDEAGKTQGSLSARFGEHSLEGSAAAKSRLSFWAGGYVNLGRGEDGATDLEQTLVGVTGGVDYRFSPRFVGGIAVGYGREVTEVGTNGTENVASAINGALYGSYKAADNFFIDGLLGYGRLDMDSTRYVTDTGAFAAGQRDGQQLFASLTAAYEHRSDSWLLSPYARVEAAWSRLDGFTESGAGAYNLVYGAQDINSLAGVLGLRAEYTIPMGWGVLKPRARVEYTHDFAGASRARLGYASLADGLPFGVDIAPLGTDSIGIGLGLEASLSSGWLFNLDYNTAFSFDGDASEHSFGARIAIRF